VGLVLVVAVVEVSSYRSREVVKRRKEARSIVVGGGGD
jgi:hypothetical protein